MQESGAWSMDRSGRGLAQASGMRYPAAMVQTRSQPPHSLRAASRAVDYPDSDGEPMAENTLQYAWIVRLVENLDALRGDFVAGDLFWYPVEGDNTLRLAPDVLVAPGRPKGHRGSYRQWEEGGQPPAVVMEVLSPGNTTREMMRKESFYGLYGVREFIVIDPDADTGWAFLYDEARRKTFVEDLDGWVSPTLGIRFARSGGALEVFGPDGERFERLADMRATLEAKVAEEKGRAEQEAQRAEQEAQRAELEAQRAELEAQRAELLAAKLRELGVDPSSL